MSSTAGTGRLTNIVKNMIALPLYQKSVVPRARARGDPVGVVGILLSSPAGTLPGRSPGRGMVIYLQLNLMKILI